MAKVVAKLFRDPASAEKVASELKAIGYKADEIGILVCDNQKAEKFARDIGVLPTTEVAPIIALGWLANALNETAKEDLACALTQLLDASEETYNYWSFGISVGGVLVSIRADETRLPQMQGIFRSVSAKATGDRTGIWANSPGFARAGRMTATDPIDAPMSGDFRRY